MPETQLEDISRTLKDLRRQYLNDDLRPHLEGMFKRVKIFERLQMLDRKLKSTQLAAAKDTLPPM